MIVNIEIIIKNAAESLREAIVISKFVNKKFGKKSLNYREFLIGVYEFYLKNEIL